MNQRMFQSISLLLLVLLVILYYPVQIFQYFLSVTATKIVKS